MRCGEGYIGEKLDETMVVERGAREACPIYTARELVLFLMFTIRQRSGIAVSKHYPDAARASEPAQ